MNRVIYVACGIILLALLANFFLVSINSETKPKKLSKAALKEILRREEVYREKKLRECIDKALQRASNDVDSIILEQALFIGADTNYRPARPVRPEEENFISRIEGVPVRPFLNRRDFVSPFQKKDTFVVDSVKLKDSLKY